MEWTDDAIVLSSKNYGESSLILSLLTRNRGRYSGYINSVNKKGFKSTIQPGNLVNVFWKSRLIEQMGKFKIELISSVSGKIFDEKLKLQALNSMCSILEKVLPERQSYSEVFKATKAFLNVIAINNEVDIKDLNI